MCGVRGRVVLHHVVAEQEIRRRGRDPWDQRNAMPLGAPLAWGGRCQCHAAHHLPGVRDTQIPLARVPSTALTYANELLGAYAMDYLRRHYATDPAPSAQG